MNPGRRTCNLLLHLQQKVAGSGKGKALRRQRTPRRGRGPAARSRARERPGVRRGGAAVGGKGTERPFSCEVVSQNGLGESATTGKAGGLKTAERLEAAEPLGRLMAVPT